MHRPVALAPAITARSTQIPRAVRVLRAASALALVVMAAAACKQSAPVPKHAPTLAELELGDNVKASGRWLMSVSPGLHRLDTPAAAHPDAIVAVHGHGSPGYEWVYPLKTLGTPNTRVYFYRWDYDQCPEQATETLRKTIDALLAAEPAIGSLRVFGHSYGGVIAAALAQRHTGATPLEVNTIAAPLAGHPSITARCGAFPITAAAAGAPVTLHQWRTQKQLDNAYKDLDTDPQIVDLPGEVTQLPDDYDGHRLGHNWSISWVADQVTGSGD